MRTKAQRTKAVPYRIEYERHDAFIKAIVHAQGDPESVTAYYAEACRTAAAEGFHRLLVESHTVNKNWTFAEARAIAEAVADSANEAAIHAIAVVTFDESSNRDAERFAVQVFENKAVSGRYFADDLPAAVAWINSA